MKRITLHITLLLAVLLVASCNGLRILCPKRKESSAYPDNNGSETKGPEIGAAGETNLNENLLDTVNVFFYKNGADSNTNAVHCVQMVLPPNSHLLSQSIFLLIFLRLKDLRSGTSTPAPATAKVYVIANATHPARSALNQIMTNASAATPSYTGTSIKSLKYLEINKWPLYQSNGTLICNGWIRCGYSDR